MTQDKNVWYLNVVFILWLASDLIALELSQPIKIKFHLYRLECQAVIVINKEICAVHNAEKKSKQNENKPELIDTRPAETK